MAKKSQTPEEKLAAALVPEEDWPYELPENWCWVRLIDGFAECLDEYRKPINAKERASRVGDVPYYGATQQVGWIDDFLTNEQLVLVGEDGAPFLDLLKNKAYIIEGKAWVNNHAHILRSLYGTSGNIFLMHYLNIFDFTDFVNGTTRLKLTQASLRQIPIPLPPKKEIHRLVAIIEKEYSKLDAAKSKVESALAATATRKAAILHAAFTGELTGTWRQENGVTDDTWKKISLKEACEKITDGTHHSPPNTDQGEYMYVTAKNIKESGIDLSNITYVSKEVHEEIYARCDVKKGDVLYIKDGATTGIATVNMMEEPFSLLSSVAVLRPRKDKLIAGYLKNYLNSSEVKAMMINNMSGNAITRLTLTKIKATNIKVCSIDEQREIVRILDTVLAREQRVTAAAEKILADIDLMKKSVLARAFRGELGTGNPSDVSAVTELREYFSRETAK